MPELKSALEWRIALSLSVRTGVSMTARSSESPAAAGADFLWRICSNQTKHEDQPQLTSSHHVCGAETDSRRLYNVVLKGTDGSELAKRRTWLLGSCRAMVTCRWNPSFTSCSCM
jgi:hypothetical protein